MYLNIKEIIWIWLKFDTLFTINKYVTQGLGFLIIIVKTKYSF